MNKQEKIQNTALRLLSKARDGVRWSELHRQIEKLLPRESPNTIHGALHQFQANLPDTIKRPERGLYKHVRFISKKDRRSANIGAGRRTSRTEDQFYSHFAEWLKHGVEECTRAIPLGGNAFGSKWGTPDVIGIYEPNASDIVKVPIEVVTAEIKIAPTGLITAFGQACAYRLFSHRTYMVVPESAGKEDLTRLDSLAQISGIGLVVFDTNRKDPEFRILVRATRHDPDMFYVNTNLKKIEGSLFSQPNAQI